MTTPLRRAKHQIHPVLEDASNEMNTLARLVIQRAQHHWRELDEHIAWCDQRIAQHARDNPEVRRASQLMGIGPIAASALVATVDDFAQFRNGAQFGAWCGITPLSAIGIYRPAQSRRLPARRDG